MMTLTPRFDAALGYASRLHRDQRRKGTDTPYVAHLLGVASLGLEMGADEDQAIAALLHGEVEDQDVSVADIAGRGATRFAAIGDEMHALAGDAIIANGGRSARMVRRSRHVDGPDIAKGH